MKFDIYVKKHNFFFYSYLQVPSLLKDLKFFKTKKFGPHLFTYLNSLL